MKARLDELGEEIEEAKEDFNSIITRIALAKALAPAMSESERRGDDESSVSGTEDRHGRALMIYSNESSTDGLRVSKRPGARCFPLSTQPPSTL